MKLKLVITFICITALQNSVFAEKLKVVATLTPFADIVRQVGGEYVDVSSIAAPRFNPHFIEPKPTDVLKVKRADLLVHAGLDLELWRGPLVDAAANSRLRSGGDRELDLSRGLKLLEVRNGPVSRAEGDIHIFGNPHYWLNPENGKIIAQSIEAKLAAIDPANASSYHSNLEAFLSKLDQSIAEWKALPLNQNKALIGYHNEWVYLMDFLGLKMKYFLEPKPGIPPTPGQIATLKALIESGEIGAVVQSSYNPSEAAKTLTSGSSVPVLTLCQQVGELSECRDYISTVNYDITEIAKNLK